MSFNATTWVEDLGFLNCFSIYSGVLGFVSLGLPLVYYYGKRIRAYTAGKLHSTPVSLREVSDDEPKTPASRVTFAEDFLPEISVPTNLFLVPHERTDSR